MMKKTLLILVAIASIISNGTVKAMQQEVLITTQVPGTAGETAQLYPADTVVKIITRDDKKIELPIAVAGMSDTISSLILDAGVENPIPLPNVSKEDIDLLVSFAQIQEKLLGDKEWAQLTKDEQFDLLVQFYRDLKDKNLSREQLVRAMYVFNYLGMSLPMADSGGVMVRALATTVPVELRGKLIKYLTDYRNLSAQAKQELKGELMEQDLDPDALVPREYRRQLLIALIQSPFVAGSVLEKTLFWDVHEPDRGPSDTLGRFFNLYQQAHFEKGSALYENEQLMNDEFVEHVISILIDAGASLYNVERFSTNPIQSNMKSLVLWSLKNAQPQLALVLLKHGANPNLSLYLPGVKPLDYADWCGYTEVYDALIARRAQFGSSYLENKALNIPPDGARC